MFKRVVVTGLGAITPLGNDVKAFWQNALAGMRGAARITHFDASLFRTQFDFEVKGFTRSDNFDRADVKRTDLFTQYSFLATDEAIKDSGFDIEKMDPYDIGVIWGTG